MIHAFSVQNFKSLNTDEVAIYPLTILSGVNNAGKTTFIKSILELTRYYERKSLTVTNLPILSNYKSKVLNHNTENPIIFHLKVDIAEDASIEIDLAFKYNEKAKGGFPNECKISYKDTDSSSYLALKKDDPYAPYEVYSERGLDLLYGKLKDGTNPPEVFKGIGDFGFYGYVPFHGKMKFDENNHLLEWFEQSKEDGHISVGVNATEILLDSIFNVKYIGPLRNHPKEFYFFESRDGEIDSSGENTFEVLDRIQDKDIKFYKSIDDTELSQMTLLEAVQYWINYFQEGAVLTIKPIAENMIQVLINGHTLNNSGFGFSQIIPIIVQALLLKKNQLLLLEQPEIHLHPELEYKLAYFMLCIVKNNRQIIAETHSEHIINQLIKSKMDDESVQKLFGIYFLEKNEDGVTDFKNIEISEYGEIKKWPKGFFDQYLQFTKDLVHKRKEKAFQKSQMTAEK